LKRCPRALADLRRCFPLRRAIIVADRGVVSEGLIEELEKQKIGYILGMKLRKNNEVRTAALCRV